MHVPAGALRRKLEEAHKARTSAARKRTRSTTSLPGNLRQLPATTATTVAAAAIPAIVQALATSSAPAAATNDRPGFGPSHMIHYGADTMRALNRLRAFQIGHGHFEKHLTHQAAINRDLKEIEPHVRAAENVALHLASKNQMTPRQLMDLQRNRSRLESIEGSILARSRLLEEGQARRRDALLRAARGVSSDPGLARNFDARYAGLNVQQRAALAAPPVFSKGPIGALRAPSFSAASPYRNQETASAASAAQTLANESEKYRQQYRLEEERAEYKRAKDLEHLEREQAKQYEILVKNGILVGQTEAEKKSQFKEFTKGEMEQKTMDAFTEWLRKKSPEVQAVHENTVRLNHDSTEMKTHIEAAKEYARVQMEKALAQSKEQLDAQREELDNELAKLRGDAQELKNKTEEINAKTNRLSSEEEQDRIRYEQRLKQVEDRLETREQELGLRERQNEQAERRAAQAEQEAIAKIRSEWESERLRMAAANERMRQEIAQHNNDVSTRVVQQAASSGILSADAEGRVKTMIAESLAQMKENQYKAMMSLLDVQRKEEGMESDIRADRRIAAHLDDSGLRRLSEDFGAMERKMMVNVRAVAGVSKQVHVALEEAGSIRAHMLTEERVKEIVDAYESLAIRNLQATLKEHQAAIDERLLRIDHKQNENQRALIDSQVKLQEEIIAQQTRNADFVREQARLDAMLENQNRVLGNTRAVTATIAENNEQRRARGESATNGLDIATNMVVKTKALLDAVRTAAGGDTRSVTAAVIRDLTPERLMQLMTDESLRTADVAGFVLSALSAATQAAFSSTEPPLPEAPAAQAPMPEQPVAAPQQAITAPLPPLQQIAAPPPSTIAVNTPSEVAPPRAVRVEITPEMMAAYNEFIARGTQPRRRNARDFDDLYYDPREQSRTAFFVPDGANSPFFPEAAMETIGAFPTMMQLSGQPRSREIGPPPSESRIVPVANNGDDEPPELLPT